MASPVKSAQGEAPPFRARKGSRIAAAGEGAEVRAVDPDDDQDDPRHPQGGDLLIEQDHGENRDEQGARSPGERIDQREVAPLVGAPHEPEVDPVDEAGGDDAVPSLDRDGGLRKVVQERRKINDSAHQEEPPDENDLPVALLEQVVPPRMEKCGGQHDAQGNTAHRPSTLLDSAVGSLREHCEISAAPRANRLHPPLHS